MEQVLSFPGLGINEIHLSRVAFSVGSLEIYWYGIIIAFGMIAAVTYVVKRSKTFGLDPDRVMDVVIGTVIGGVIGARLYFVIFSWDQFAGDLMQIFNTRNGGLAIYGGIIGGALALILMCKLRKVRFRPMGDIAVCGVILGQAIGRWGNFVNIEAFGSNTTLPWGMTSPVITNYLSYYQDALAAQGVMVDPSLPVHPTFLYESLWCFAGFALLAYYTKKRRFDGEMILIYFTWYSLGRAWIEGLRTDSLMLGDARVSQMLAIILAIGALIAWMAVRAQMEKRNDPAFLPLYVNTEEGKAVVAGTFYKKKEKEEDAKSGEEAAPESEPEAVREDEMRDGSEAD